MLAIKKILIFLFLNLTSVFSKSLLKAPVFSNQYSSGGILTIPYAEIKEPLFAWYDGKSGNSRIDYYGGMVKTYQLGNDGPYGSSIKLAPMTTESALNQETCFKISGEEEMAIKPQSILPSTEGMECIGSDVINGHECEKWQEIVKFGEKENKYTLWIKWEPSTVSGVKQAIPVRYEMKGFNSLLGSHYDHYYVDYESYSYDAPDPKVFTIVDNVTCSGFPGPGSRHLYTFNPIKEFIHNEDGHVDIEFELFKKKHKKTYVSHKEHENRRNIFKQNLRYINAKNRENLGFTLDVNHFGDHTVEEMQSRRGKQYTKVKYNGGKQFPYKKDLLMRLVKALPDNLDWRLYGAVTPVKDQSVCGSCWSFGTTGAVEGAYFMKHHKLVTLSEQALVDCSWGYGNNGCDGGEDYRAYKWIMKHGIPNDEAYGGYLGQDGYCHYQNVSSTAKMTGFVNVTPLSVEALKVALSKHGPISIAIDASQRTFSFYSNGVYYDANCGNTEDRLDHAVLLVGYGTMDGKDYWLVKNSWSTYWGNDGYILMAQKDNNCGVLDAPTYALVE